MIVYCEYHGIKITDDKTIWLSDFLVRKWGGVSNEYLAKVRSIYKKSTGLSFKTVYDTTLFLPKISKSWRWGIQDGRYWYDLDTIPNHAPVYYRSLLPCRWEIFRQIDAIEEGISGGDIIQSARIYGQDGDSLFYKEKGFDKVKIRHLYRAGAWINFIKRVVKFEFYEGYGFRTKEDFFIACRRAIKYQRLNMLIPMDINEVLTISDSSEGIRQFLINRFDRFT